MDIVEATREFEKWLERKTAVVRSQLTAKHRAMAEGPLEFLRGTIYHWAQVWPAVCPQLARAPSALSVGDLHIESFGTWRDAMGRLVWGVDDFDEAFPLPYTQDLVRLATSARLAICNEKLALSSKAACDAILEGYREGLDSGGSPFVLEEQHHWLRTIALHRLDDPRPFWDKLAVAPTARKPIPRDALHALQQCFPEPRIPCRIAARTAGIGSNGHRRLVAISDWREGKIALEAKALVPSAFNWPQRTASTLRIYYKTMLEKTVRSRDPFVRVSGHWIVRHLAPDSSPIELVSLPQKRPEDRLLHAMGWEAANCHLASPRSVKPIQSDLNKRPADWLRRAARDMEDCILKDWKQWKKYQA